MAQKWNVTAKIFKAIDDAKQALEEFTSDQEMQWDDMSEQWQEGERGSAVQAWIEQLDDLVDELETVRDSLADIEQPDLG